MSRELEVGENFESWEHRIDYQLAFAHDRIDTLRDNDRAIHAEIGTLQGRLDRTEGILADVRDRARTTTVTLSVALALTFLLACVAFGLAVYPVLP